MNLVLRLEAVGLCPKPVENSIDNEPVNFLGSSLSGVGEL